MLAIVCIVYLVEKISNYQNKCFRSLTCTTVSVRCELAGDEFPLKSDSDNTFNYHPS